MTNPDKDQTLTKLQTIHGDALRNKIPRNVPLFRSYLLHELDFLRLTSLALKNHNNKPQHTKDPQPPEKSHNPPADKPVGGLQMEPESQAEINQLRQEINRIMDLTDQSLENKNDMIVKLIQRNRRKRLLKREREILPEARNNVFQGAGAIPNNNNNNNNDNNNNNNNDNKNNDNRNS